MIEKLLHKIPLSKQDTGNFVISGTYKGTHEYYREPTKKELIDKINELIELINGNQNRVNRS